SSTSPSYKKLIISELKYISYNYLNDFARTAVSNQVVRDSLIINVFGNINPEPDVFPAGPQYYAFVDNYIRYLETVAFTKIKTEKIPTNKPIPFFKISLDSANIIVKKYGKSYWRWLGSTENFSNKVAEEFNFQSITELFIYKDLRPLEVLANLYKKKFPQGKYLSRITAMVDTLKNTLLRNENNNQIIVYNGFEKLNSLSDVIKKLKGKVVYVDVWGTWCPPCKEELKYNPQLKAKFNNKEVAFIYLDMDEDDKDAFWREFIKINNLTGIHLRKSREEMKPFWKELLANNPDKAEYYPQYFIFDKEGKLAISKALQPSNKEELYKQIESVLSKNR
ncbi:MAG: TlpA family protein disulfide reductase, partial [Sphingobacteriales bacterium]